MNTVDQLQQLAPGLFLGSFRLQGGPGTPRQIRTLLPPLPLGIPDDCAGCRTMPAPGMMPA